MAEFEKTDQALAQFNASIEQLESAMGALRTNASGAQKSQEEFVKVSQELEHLRSRAQHLADVNRKSGERIDTLISEIRTILEKD